MTEAQLQLLVGQGRHPQTGEPLGRAYSVFGPSKEADSGPAARRAVAGFDFTFSVPKSASVVWAVADASTQSLIVAAHHSAVADVISFMEREVAATRVGASDGTGAVAQMDVTGLIATAFDHFESRSGDPHLHTHVVISNKVQSVFDGKWRALDGRPMHAAVVALSELHAALFADELTRSLGVGWEQREHERNRNPGWDIRGVPATLMSAFSSRSRQIGIETDELIDRHVRQHGRRPGAVTILKLRAQATLTTRPEKRLRSLAEATASWRAQASVILGADATRWAGSITDERAPALLRAGEVTPEVFAHLGRDVVEAVGEKRSTWRRWNLAAEAARQTMGLRFATVADREMTVSRIVQEAERRSVRLTPPDVASTPAMFQRADGSSRFRPGHSIVYSSQRLLAAEDRLLALARDASGPCVNATIVRLLNRTGVPRRHPLGVDQQAALTTIATSGRVVDVLVGPAGSGKSTAMRALRVLWEGQHGSGSVVGLAPSAVAAAVLGTELGIGAENTAKWLHDYDRDRGRGFRSGQLVIIDEASLAGTLGLERIAGIAVAAGAKVLLVGDPAQLQAVDAGGAFALLVRDRNEPPTLDTVHRFAHDWEKTASLGLRDGDPTVLDAYLRHARLMSGDNTTMTDRAYSGWKADTAAGRTSVLIAETADAVRELNVRARDDRVRAGTTAAGQGVALHDGTELSAGDVVVTRRNDRRLRTGTAWVRNGDRWAVRAVGRDGSIAVRPVGRRRGGIVRLPPSYVADHVELGYAITAHRAQGLTVDAAHAVVTGSSTRESLYVAMTRGRDSNTAYVATDRADDVHDLPHPADDPDATARTVLLGVLARVGAEQSAHATLRAEQDSWSNIGRLAAEYDTIATAAQDDRWAALIRSSPLTPERADAILASDAFGPLTASLRRAEAHHHDVDALLPRLVAARGFDDAADPAAVLEDRLTRATARPAGSARTPRPPLLIAGLIPEAVGQMDTEMRQALDERRDLIERRAAALAAAALGAREPWTQALGSAPRDARGSARWRRQVQVIAAYRDRYTVEGDRPLGPSPASTSQQRDAAHAAAALARAQHYSTDATLQSATPSRDRAWPELER